MASLGEQTVGSTVKLNVNGAAMNFIVVHQGLPSSVYDSSCDGTWLLMEDCYIKRTYGGSENNYGNSDLHSYLNNTFYNLLDSDIKEFVKHVKIPYVPVRTSEAVTGSNGLSTKVFVLSLTEVNVTPASYAKIEGSVLSYFNGADSSKRIAKYNGTATNWLLRSPMTNVGTRVWYITKTGSNGPVAITTSYGVRPALVLPYELNVSEDGFMDGSVASSGGISGQVPINGVMCELTGEGYININGVLCPISDSGVNIGGILNSAKG